MGAPCSGRFGTESLAWSAFDRDPWPATKGYALALLGARNGDSPVRTQNCCYGFDRSAAAASFISRWGTLEQPVYYGRVCVVVQ